MANTTKDESISILDDLKAQALALSAKIKEETDKHLESLHLKLKDAHGVVQHLTAEIQKHSGKPAPAKRGRKGKDIGPIGTVSDLKATGTKRKASKKGKSQRGAVGEAIASFLASKGKSGAHVKDIATAIGNKPANVTAFFYSKKGKAEFKNVAPATFAVKK